MSNFRGLALCLLAVTSLSGCAAQQRREAGAGLAIVGLTAAAVGASVALGCVPWPDESSWDATEGNGASCAEGQSSEPNPDVGVPVLTLGFGTAVLGGILYGTGQ